MTQTLKESGDKVRIRVTHTLVIDKEDIVDKFGDEIFEQESVVEVEVA